MNNNKKKSKYVRMSSEDFKAIQGYSLKRRISLRYRIGSLE